MTPARPAHRENRGAAWLGRQADWGLVAAWALVILALGGDDLSAADTAGWLEPLFRRLLPGLSPDALAGLHFALRKSAHAVEYGVLALLADRAWAHRAARRPARRAALALAVVLAVAGLDESRQAFSPVRGGSAADVALDLAGGVAALLGRAAWLRRPRRRDVPPAAAGDAHV